MAETNTLTKSTKQEVATAISNSSIADSIIRSFDTLATQGHLSFPKNYSVGNELKLMYASLSQSGVLGKVTTVSVGEALCQAVIQGLQIEKNQVYFIPYANKLTMFRSYYGDVAVAKNTGLVKDVFARVIYDGDEYEIDTDETGQDIVVGHKTKLNNRDNAIVGAYAWAVGNDGARTYCIMTWKEIQTNWSKSKAGGGVHKEFPQEMAKRTVIRRLVKMIFNTSPSLSLEQQTIINSYNQTTADEYDNSPRDYSKSNKPKTTVGNFIEEEDIEVGEETTPAEVNEETGEVVSLVEEDK